MYLSSQRPAVLIIEMKHKASHDQHIVRTYNFSKYVLHTSIWQWTVKQNYMKNELRMFRNTHWGVNIMRNEKAEPDQNVWLRVSTGMSVTQTL